MKRVHVFAEGQTEEAFVRELVAPWAGARGVSVSVSCFSTRSRRGAVHKGGLQSFERARHEITTALAEDAGRYVSTMFDYYRLPADFPRPAQVPAGASPDTVARLHEAAIGAAIGSPRRFIPYLQMHEFEALVIAAGDVVVELLDLKGESRRAFEMLRTTPPEEINDGFDTAPSRRLLSMHPPYEKLFDGRRITEAAGLEVLRAQCPHFDDWIERLVALP